MLSAFRIWWPKVYVLWTKNGNNISLSPLNNFPELHVLMGIVKTSGIPLGVDAREGGIFPTFSRFKV